MSYQRITMDHVKNIYNQLKPEEVILDVRTEDEFQEGHVPGALNISHDELSEHLEQLKKFSTIYVYCRAGRRAEFAVQVILKASEQIGPKKIFCVSQGGMPNF